MENKVKSIEFIKEYNEIKDGIISLYPDAKIENANVTGGGYLVYENIACHIDGKDENNKYLMDFNSLLFMQDNNEMTLEETISVEDATISEIIEFIMTNPPDKILNYFK